MACMRFAPESVKGLRIRNQGNIRQAGSYASAKPDYSVFSPPYGPAVSTQTSSWA